MSSNTVSRESVDWYQIDWDEWRREHSSLSFADQQAFYCRVAELYPKQENFDLGAAHETFDRIHGEALEVAELGGWNGALAASMLYRSDIANWMNYDLIEVPQAFSSPYYQLKVLDNYLWEGDPVVADVFVACHTIEHLTAEELGSLFGVLDVSYVYLEAPLKLEPIDWTGYPGSHILEIGWNGVAELLDEHGYTWAAPGLWQR